MAHLTKGDGTNDRNSIFQSIAAGRRRRILALLGDEPSPVTEEELAIHLAATEQAKPPSAVTDEEVRSLRADLVHVQLPRLRKDNLIDWDTQSGTVVTTDHPVLDDPKFQRIIETEADRWDDVLANLAHRLRRIVISALADRETPIARADLTHGIANRETTLEYESIESLDASLHHVHLPKLQQAGLVAYDPATGMVAYEGHPTLDEAWLDSNADETPPAVLPSARKAEDVWTIEGRDNVVARGQSLFEQADDELFLMFTTAGLLEEGCIRRVQDAIDRGVDVYLGSQTPEVRDIVRERVPGVLIWEPQMDWLNLPPDHEKVGRLVFSDRNAIMLATLGERTSKGVHEETAITGTGENNPLVMLMRELLGSRLDHLDSQSEDFRSEIPL